MAYLDDLHSPRLDEESPDQNSRLDVSYSAGRSWLKATAVAWVDSPIAINMCDLSAHAFKTSYVCISTCMGCLFGCSVRRLAYCTKNV